MAQLCPAAGHGRQWLPYRADPGQRRVRHHLSRRSICWISVLPSRSIIRGSSRAASDMTVRPTTTEDAAAVRGVPRAIPARGAGAGPARPCRRRRRRHRARADLLRGVRHLLPGDGLRRGSQPRQHPPPGARRSRLRRALRSLLTQLLSEHPSRASGRPACTATSSRPTSSCARATGWC